MHLINQYIDAQDGTPIAISIWQPEIEESQPRPVILVTTRYWRAIHFQNNQPEQQGYYGFAELLHQQGYQLVVADARGSGASFGSRLAEVDHHEVSDIHDLIEWISEQPWCDGRVLTTGTSYSAITTLYSLVSGSKALAGGVCRAPDFDMYRHLFAPGGIINRWFISEWGRLTAAQDANDVEAVFAGGYFPAPSEGIANILGVQPVDNDTEQHQLKKAVSQHQANFNIASVIDSLDYIEQFISGKNPQVYDTTYQAAIEQNKKPLIIRCGWHDAGTALGALAMYATLDHPMRVIIGPFNHDGSHYVDPFFADDQATEADGGMDEGRGWRMEGFKRLLDRQAETLSPTEDTLRAVEYYTLGENRWKKTQQWPLPATQLQRYYFGENNRLEKASPVDKQGHDHYRIDSNASTGRANRWHAQASEQPVHFPDRQDEDKKLIVYDTEPLEGDLEITGHPIVTLFVTSSTVDGHFFVYLESIDPDGRVRLITEGQLRGLHRKVSLEIPPYKFFGPYHSLKAKDAQPLTPGEVTEISFDLLPLSVRFTKGQRLRIAIAGADKDTFAPLKGCSDQQITLERNRIHASCIDLPIIPAAGEKI